MLVSPRRKRSSRTLGSWAPTAAHVRAVTVCAVAALAAAVGRRPDLLVIIAPLAVAAAWGQLARPTGPVTASAEIASTSLREGEAATIVVQTEPVNDALEGVVTLALSPFVERRPDNGVVMLSGGQGRLAVRTTRWGRRPVGTVSLSLTSVFDAFRVGPVDLPDLQTETLPVPAAFDTGAPTPHPRGVVGQNRSSRPGSGAEFATIRRFHPGDRLRRVHWPVSTRTGVLHVTSTFTDEDAHVFVLLDAYSDLGPREGIDGRPTSLDVSVRAAGAIAEHFLQAGDRLTLRTVGAADVPLLRTGSGTGHLRRVLDLLASVAPATERRDEGERAIRGIDPMALCLVLTPLIDSSMVALAHTLAARGLTLVVVDTFPEHLVHDARTQYEALAWRVRLLSREAQVSSLVARGVPVVPWRGPGSLDHVLRDAARRSAAPRMARR